MLRFFSACALSVVFTVSSVNAADLPMFLPKDVHGKAFKVAIKHAKTAAILPDDPLSTAAKPVLAATAPVIAPNTIAAQPDQPVANVAPVGSDMKLSWTLDTLVANADGGKNEGSASVTGNLVIHKPRIKFGSALTIELIGHIIKTPQSEVRLDVQIGPVKRTVVWNSDEVKSGIFKIILDEKMPAADMAGNLPASVLAFVTKHGDGAAAMISLEKVNLHLGKVNLADVDADQ